MGKSKFALTTSLLLTAAAWLAACSPPAATIPSPKPVVGVSPEQRQCAARCLNNNIRCESRFNRNYAQCSVNAKRWAQLGYNNYVGHQLATKQDIKRSPNSFYHTSQCREHLECTLTYSKCYDTCGL